MPLRCELQVYYHLGTNITGIGHDHIAVLGAKSSSDLLLLTGTLTSSPVISYPVCGSF